MKVSDIYKFYDHVDLFTYFVIYDYHNKLAFEGQYQHMPLNIRDSKILSFNNLGKRDMLVILEKKFS